MSEAYATTHWWRRSWSGRWPAARMEGIHRLDRARVDGAIASEPEPQRLGHAGHLRRDPVRERRQLLRIGRLGHRDAVFGPHFLGLERRREMEDRLAVLDRDHPAGGERLPVADAIHQVEDRGRRVARAEEIGMQRVDVAAVDRAARGDQRLPGHLAAEDPLAVL